MYKILYVFVSVCELLLAAAPQYCATSLWSGSPSLWCWNSSPLSEEDVWAKRNLPQAAFTVTTNFCPIWTCRGWRVLCGTCILELCSPSELFTNSFIYLCHQKLDRFYLRPLLCCQSICWSETGIGTMFLDWLRTAGASCAKQQCLCSRYYVLFTHLFFSVEVLSFGSGVSAWLHWLMSVWLLVDLSVVPGRQSSL